MYIEVNTQCVVSPDERWEAAIRDAQDKLARFEERAERLRWTIRTLRELRDAGEPWGENALIS